MKNPFSIYDFLGYLFPGILFVLMLLDAFSGKNILTIESLLNSDKKVELSLESCFLYVIVSYVMGHVVAYVSSLLVEDFANRLFDYPSKYLLTKENIAYKELWRRFFGTKVFTKNECTKKCILGAKIILKIIIFVILLPITLSVFTIGYFFEINHFITRELDPYLVNAIKKKTNYLAKAMDITDHDLPDNEDTHRFVMHYAYINIKECQPKVGNYIALYGFLRCMSLLTCILFDYLLFKGILSINIHATVDWTAIFKLASTFLTAYILFLGFVKFYRRNTLEDYMTILVEKMGSKNADKQKGIETVPNK